ncbi:MAG TPA: hypothetical protein VHM70_06690 [Polyangiaceae bacterium]|nr:hypothetical protein [Polyangiaceae bacterium]
MRTRLTVFVELTCVAGLLVACTEDSTSASNDSDSGSNAHELDAGLQAPSASGPQAGSSKPGSGTPNSTRPSPDGTDGPGSLPPNAGDDARTGVDAGGSGVNAGADASGSASPSGADRTDETIGPVFGDDGSDPGSDAGSSADADAGEGVPTTLPGSDDSTTSSPDGGVRSDGPTTETAFQDAGTGLTTSSQVGTNSDADVPGDVDAGPVLTQTFEFGVPDPGCASEGASCAQDVLPGTSSVEGSVFVNVFNGGYRAGGHVSWDFSFDDSLFASVTSMTMSVTIVGFLGAYLGNIDADAGQIGNYFAIDDVPVEPILDNSDARDTHVFAIPILSPGAHTFSVWAYDQPPGPNYEGWGGVDMATLTVQGKPL